MRGGSGLEIGTDTIGWPLLPGRPGLSGPGFIDPKRVDQGEAQPWKDGQVELIFNLIRIIEHLTWTI